MDPIEILIVYNKYNYTIVNTSDISEVSSGMVY